jgi:hypothetical protein
MREIPAYFDVALREIGQAEINGPDHNQRIIEYHEQTSLKASDDETPWQGHVGFVHAWNADHIQLLGGNQNDSVSLEWYPVGRLVGLRRPS